MMTLVAEQLDYRFVRIQTPVGALDIRAVPNADTPEELLFQVAVVRSRSGVRIVDADEPERSAAPLAIKPVGVARFRKDGSPVEDWCSISLRAIGLPSAEHIIADAIDRYIGRCEASPIAPVVEDESPSYGPRF